MRALSRACLFGAGTIMLLNWWVGEGIATLIGGLICFASFAVLGVPPGAVDRWLGRRRP